MHPYQAQNSSLPTPRLCNFLWSLCDPVCLWQMASPQTAREGCVTHTYGVHCANCSVMSSKCLYWISTKRGDTRVPPTPTGFLSNLLFGSLSFQAWCLRPRIRLSFAFATSRPASCHPAHRELPLRDSLCPGTSRCLSVCLTHPLSHSGSSL